MQEKENLQKKRSKQLLLIFTVEDIEPIKQEQGVKQKSLA